MRLDFSEAYKSSYSEAFKEINPRKYQGDFREIIQMKLHLISASMDDIGLSDEEKQRIFDRRVLRIMKFKLVEQILDEEVLEEGLHAYLRDVANLMATNGYTNIVIDYHTNKIIGDKSNKTYLFEIIFNNINPKLNDRFYVNYLSSVNNNAKVYPVTTTYPVGLNIGKAGIGFPRSENRRQYIPGVVIWELNRLAPIDPTTWP